MQRNKLQQVWEFTFLIDMQLFRKNYTLAFIQFVQTLERLLSVQCDSYNWVDKGFTNPPPNRNGQPDLSGLIQGWCKSQNLMSDSKWYKLLDSIRYKRNKVIHDGEFVTWEQMRSLWTMGNLFSVAPKEDPQVLQDLMMQVIKKVSTPSRPETLLVRSLYNWGVKILRAESADF